MNTFLGPVLFLLLFILSAIICTLLFGYSPFILWSEHKDTKKAVRVVIYTTGWLIVFGLFVAMTIFALR
jgi:hypothetical protein